MTITFIKRKKYVFKMFPTYYSSKLTGGVEIILKHGTWLMEKDSVGVDISAHIHLLYELAS